MIVLGAGSIPTMSATTTTGTFFQKETLSRFKPYNVDRDVHTTSVTTIIFLSFIVAGFIQVKKSSLIEAFSFLHDGLIVMAGPRPRQIIANAPMVGTKLMWILNEIPRNYRTFLLGG